jgi:hypothetical protein
MHIRTLRWGNFPNSPYENRLDLAQAGAHFLLEGNAFS